MSAVAESPSKRARNDVIVEIPDSPRLMPGKRRRVLHQPSSSVSSDADASTKSASPVKRTARMLSRKPTKTNTTEDVSFANNTPKAIRSVSLPDLSLASLTTPPLIRKNSVTDLLTVPHEFSSDSPRRSPSPSPKKATYGSSNGLGSPVKGLQPQASTSKVTLDLDNKKHDPLSIEALQVEQKSYFELRRKWGSDAESDDDQLTTSGNKVSNTAADLGLKGINALRTQGYNKRFDDELAYTLDGLNPTEPIGLRRASALQLLKKCTELPDFVRRLRVGGDVTKIYWHFEKAKRNCIDLVGASPSLLLLWADRLPYQTLDVCFALFIALILKDDKDVDSFNDLFVSSSNFVPSILELLSRKYADEAISSSNKSKSFSKQERVQLGPLRQIIDAVYLWKDDLLPPTQVTLHRITVSALTFLVLNRTFAGSVLSKHAPHLFQSLSDRLLKDSKEETDLVALESYFSIIEASTSAELGLTESIPYPPLAASSICDCLSFLFREACKHDLARASAAMDCLLSAFKCLINLTNLSSSFAVELFECRQLLPTIIRCIASSVDAISHQDDEVKTSSVKLDLLALSLGFLTNLLEVKSKHRPRFVASTYSPVCTGAIECLSCCNCPNQESVIYLISHLYSMYLSHMTAEASLVFSYARALLGLLIVDDQDLQEQVKGRLKIGQFQDLQDCMRTLLQQG